jgi:hypothetical protein
VLFGRKCFEVALFTGAIWLSGRLELQIKQRSNCTKFSIIYFMFAMGSAATIRVGNQKA